MGGGGNNYQEPPRSNEMRYNDTAHVNRGNTFQFAKEVNVGMHNPKKPEEPKKFTYADVAYTNKQLS